MRVVGSGGMDCIFFSNESEMPKCQNGSLVLVRRRTSPFLQQVKLLPFLTTARPRAITSGDRVSAIDGLHSLAGYELYLWFRN